MKKLLGLLAIAPMSIAACGGSTDTDKDKDADKVFDTKTVETGEAWAAVHGDTILSGEQAIPADSSITIADVTGATACDDIDGNAAALTAAVEEIIAPNGYTYDFANVVVAANTDTTICDLTGTFDVTPSSSTSTFAGLGKATAGVNAANEITEITIDETEWQDWDAVATEHVRNSKDRIYVVRELYNATKMDANGYRELTEAEATSFETTFENEGYTVEWKTANDEYMGSAWNPTIKAMIDHMIGMTVKEAKEFAEDLEAADNADSDYLEDITGASEGMSHDYHYAKMAILAIEKAVEANSAE